MAVSQPVNVRVPAPLLSRLDAAVERAGVNRSQWVLAAIECQVEQDEAASNHVPKVIVDALPVRRGSGMVMPVGRVLPRTLS